MTVTILSPGFRPADAAGLGETTVATVLVASGTPVMNRPTRITKQASTFMAGPARITISRLVRLERQ